MVAHSLHGPQNLKKVIFFHILSRHHINQNRLSRRDGTGFVQCNRRNHPQYFKGPAPLDQNTTSCSPCHPTKHSRRCRYSKCTWAGCHQYCHRPVKTVSEWFIDQDRKSTRLNSSHVAISYAVFCLK